MSKAVLSLSSWLKPSFNHNTANGLRVTFTGSLNVMQILTFPPIGYLDIGKNNADVEGAVNHMQVLVQSCLMDPGFPSLVEAVEKSLKKVMSFEDV